MAGEDWSDDENDAIVADYFAMLTDDISGRTYNKAEHNRALQKATGRSRGSVEFKHRNISTVVTSFGIDWLTGYRPATNIQDSLIEAVVRWLDANELTFERTVRTAFETKNFEFAEDQTFWVGPPPTSRNAPPPQDLQKLMRAAIKRNVAERDAQNRALGRAGEDLVVRREKSVLTTVGRSDLAEKVVWVSDQVGDGLGYDVASFDERGRERLIEVKTTNGWDRTPFHVSRNELAVADANRDTWLIMRLWNFSREPSGFEIRPPLEEHVELTPTSFQANIL